MNFFQKTVGISLFGLAVIALQGCTQTKKDSSTVKIFGGSDVTTGPIVGSTVALRIKGQIFCTGTVISDDLVLTAAHCNPFTTLAASSSEVDNRDTVASQQLKEMNIAFGHDSAHPDAERKIIDLKSHPDFINFVSAVDRAILAVKLVGFSAPSDLNIINDKVENGGWHDLALMRFSGGHPSGASAASLSQALHAKGSAISMAGFGISEVGKVDFGLLKKADSEVNVSDAARAEISANALKQGTCKGDSGGPALSISGNIMTLVAVTSRGVDSNTCKSEKSFFTDVSSHLAWIKSAAASLGGTLSSSASSPAAPAPAVPAPVVVAPATASTCAKNNNKGSLVCEISKKCFYTPATGLCSSSRLPTF